MQCSDYLLPNAESELEAAATGEEVEEQAEEEDHDEDKEEDLGDLRRLAGDTREAKQACDEGKNEKRESKSEHGKPLSLRRSRHSPCRAWC